ncbi:hypothetical protein A6K24_00665 [Metabacillus litoralis]|uniref:Uncharacterized protein n=1 Tax=Metabacillus litoralis TaxID=152268 RepID=A0A179T7J3_9BACI|nr:hypothetical protein A6K24_00665 [Metabacillus litoralis]
MTGDTVCLSAKPSRILDFPTKEERPLFLTSGLKANLPGVGGVHHPLLLDFELPNAIILL